MINGKHKETLKTVVGHLIDEIVIMQSALNEDNIGPEQIRNFYAAVDFAEFRIAAIMGSASVDLDGVYNADD